MYNLTDLANKVIQTASQFASQYGSEVGTEHILYALTKVDSKSKKLLKAYRVDSEIVKQILDGVANGIPSNVVELTPRSKELLMIASSVAKRTHSAYISTEHLLVALLSQEDSFAINILAGALKLNVYEMRNKAIGMITNNQSNSPSGNGDFSSNGFVQVGNMGQTNESRQEAYTSELPDELLEMGSDLTLRAKNGKIDPIIGRDSEIERMI